MKTYPLCDPYVWENPRALLNSGFVWHSRKEGPCASELINHIIFVFLMAFIVGTVLQVAAVQPMMLVITMGLATAYTLPAFWKLFTIRAAAEGFQEVQPPSNEIAKAKAEEASKLRTMADLVRPTGEEAYEVYDVIGGAGGGANAVLTLPTARNPFMNVLIDELKYSPTRPMAASIYDPSVKVALDDFFRTDFYKDPTDVFGRTQGQRQFVTMPSTSIPNDQESYQNWLYKIPGKTCKEGGREACMPGTDGGALPWLNVSP
jgi:hypothetical protein